MPATTKPIYLDSCLLIYLVEEDPVFGSSLGLAKDILTPAA